MGAKGAGRNKYVSIHAVLAAIGGIVMSDNKLSQPPTPPEENNTLTGSPSVDEILKNARIAMGTITELAETAKAAAMATVESQRLTAAALTDAQTKLADITTTATQALAAKTQIADDQSVIATKSDHIQNAQVHADTVRASLDRTLTAATQQATEVEGQKSRAQSAADTVTELLADLRTTKGSVETDAEAVVTARKTAEQSAALTKGLAEKSATVEARIEDYEARLADLESQCKTQLKTIVDLLPGATSAGLAHAFDERRQTFLKPQRLWERWFIGSVVAIVVLAVTSLMQVILRENPLTYDEVLLLWLSRLPVAGALVWLALHASHESALAKRLEEDYGYKSAVASSFLGFHKQMSEIGSAAGSNIPLAKLCEDTLTTIASPPGRIYDKHKLTVSPTGELTGVAKAATGQG